MRKGVVTYSGSYCSLNGSMDRANSGSGSQKEFGMARTSLATSRGWSDRRVLNGIFWRLRIGASD